MINADSLRRLAALKLAPEAMAEVLSVVADMQSAEEDRKAKQRARTTRFREKNVTVTLQERDYNVTSNVTTPSSLVPKETPPGPPKEITLNPTIPTNMGSARDFAEFWELYPNKVGKGIAEKSFFSARRSADQTTLIAGLHRYIESKPPDRDWCNPSTWLNQQRWLDAPAKPQSNRRDHRNERPDGFTAAFDRLEARIAGRADHEPEEPERRGSPDDFGGRLQLVARSDF